jgi:hypothetical protein
MCPSLRSGKTRSVRMWSFVLAKGLYENREASLSGLGDGIVVMVTLAAQLSSIDDVRELS